MTPAHKVRQHSSSSSSKLNDYWSILVGQLSPFPLLFPPSLPSLYVSPSPLFQYPSPIINILTTPTPSPSPSPNFFTFTPQSPHSHQYHPSLPNFSPTTTIYIFVSPIPLPFPLPLLPPIIITFASLSPLSRYASPVIIILLFSHCNH